MKSDNSIVNLSDMFYEYSYCIDVAINVFIFTERGNLHLAYEDLRQVGSIALLKAIKTYDSTRGAKLKTHAVNVIKNAIYDYIKYQVRISGKTENIADYEVFGDSSFINKLDDIFLFDFLKNIKKDYSGTILRGIEAITLKIYGYTNKDISEFYGVKQNEVSAWISRAGKTLIKDNNVKRYFEII